MCRARSMAIYIESCRFSLSRSEPQLPDPKMLSRPKRPLRHRRGNVAPAAPLTNVEANATTSVQSVIPRVCQVLCLRGVNGDFERASKRRMTGSFKEHAKLEDGESAR